MEKNFYTDDFEQLLREKTDEFRMYPSKRVWHSIYNDLHPSRKWPSIAVSMLMLLALLFLGYLNTNDNASTTIVAASKQNSNNNNQANNSNQTNSTATDNLNSTTAQTEDATQINNLPATANSINNNSTAVNNSGTLSGKNKENSSLNNKPVIQLGNRHELATNKKGSDKQLYASTVTNKAKHRQHKNGNNEVVTGDNIFTSISIGNANSVSENNNKSNSGTTITQNTMTEGTETNANLNNNNSSQKSTNTSDANLTASLLNVTNAATNKLKASDDKAWIEDYALYNKSGKNKWKDRVAMELYATPSIGYRTLGTDINPVMPTAAFGQSLSTGDKKISQHPALGLEAGIGLAYSFAKNLRLKAGVQVNYTSYGVDADQTNHPILTNLLMNDPNNGHTFLSSYSSTLSNSYGLNPVTVHNTTFQFSVPIGLAFRIAGNNKMEWYAGASVQPSFIMGGATHFISSDYNNYVSDQTLLRRWNMNTGIETYLNYKLGGFALQVGPQLRYQLFSTYNKKSTVTEKLYNMGLKVGVVKSF